MWTNRRFWKSVIAFSLWVVTRFVQQCGYRHHSSWMWRVTAKSEPVSRERSALTYGWWVLEEPYHRGFNITSKCSDPIAHWCSVITQKNGINTGFVLFKLCDCINCTLQYRVFVCVRAHMWVVKTSIFNYNWINQLLNTTIWWLDICCLLHRYQLHVSALMAIFRLIDWQQNL